MKYQEFYEDSVRESGDMKYRCSLRLKAVTSSPK